MIVFGGSSHFQAVPQSAFSLLKDQGIRCSVVEFAENPQSVKMDLKTARLLGKEPSLALRVTAESQRQGARGAFMLPYDRETLVQRWLITMDSDLQVAALPVSK
jgi:hypothetical protein